MRAFKVAAWSLAVGVGGLCACTALIGAEEPIEVFGSDGGGDGTTRFCPFPPCDDSGDALDEGEVSDAGSPVAIGIVDGTPFVDAPPLRIPGR